MNLLDKADTLATKVVVGGDETAPVIDVKLLHATIGELTSENDFLAGALGNTP